jgi:hypothetical protein
LCFFQAGEKLNFPPLEITRLQRLKSDNVLGPSAAGKTGSIPEDLTGGILGFKIKKLLKKG